MRGYPLTSKRASPLTRPLASAPSAPPVPPAPPAYVAPGLSFPAGAYLYGSGGASNTDSVSVFSASFWCRATLPWNGIGENRTIVDLANSLGRGMTIQRFNNGGGATPTIALQAINSTAGQSRTYSCSNAALLADELWHHFLLSFQQPGQNDNQRHFFFDDIFYALTIGSQTSTSWTNYMHSSERTIGRKNHPTVTRDWKGDLADVWLSTTQYIDFSIEANRRKFITADKRPVYLGENGELPTGVAPEVFVTGPASGVGDNRGSYPNWSITTGVVDAASNP